MYHFEPIISLNRQLCSQNRRSGRDMVNIWVAIVILSSKRVWARMQNIIRFRRWPFSVQILHSKSLILYEFQRSRREITAGPAKACDPSSSVASIVERALEACRICAQGAECNFVHGVDLRMYLFEPIKSLNRHLCSQNRRSGIEMVNIWVAIILLSSNRVWARMQNIKFRWWPFSVQILHSKSLITLWVSEKQTRNHGRTC